MNLSKKKITSSKSGRGYDQNVFKTGVLLFGILSGFAILSTPIHEVALAETLYIPETSSAIRLATDSHSVIISDRQIPQIVPGESATAKTEREAKEAAQKAAADAVAAKAKRDALSREYRVYADPSNFDEIYAGAGNTFGVDSHLLKAIHIVETGASGSTSRRNDSGAQGPMQFLPSTFSRHAVDGNGDGITDINNVSDAIYTAARYLHDCGYPNLKKALWGYNPSASYYNKVTRIAVSFGMPI